MNGLDQQQHQEAADDTTEWAQQQLDTHPDASPFWDSNSGQEALAIAKAMGLTATNTNRERCAIYREMREAA
jgi:hypothetical protein